MSAKECIAVFLTRHLFACDVIIICTVTLSHIEDAVTYRTDARLCGMEHLIAALVNENFTDTPLFGHPTVSAMKIGHIFVLGRNHNLPFRVDEPP